jgi:N-acetylglucosaminyldiphosphoundecaprenol N-acetyl-beta-D-mannosaminyltransferase
MSSVHESAPEVSTCQIAGVPISRLGSEQTLETLRGWLAGDRPRRVATANLDFLRLAANDKELLETLKTADLVTADGWPLVFLSKLLGTPIHERVAGADLVPSLLGVAAQEGRSVFFLGGGKGVAQHAARRMIDINPGLKIAGVAAPFLDWSDPREAGRIADLVRNCRADLLVVALGCPRQEYFLRDYAQRAGVRVGIGVGATLDFIAGRVARAPLTLQRTNLEWAFRLAQEPRRLTGRYVRDLSYFAKIGKELLLDRVGHPSAKPAEGLTDLT